MGKKTEAFTSLDKIAGTWPTYAKLVEETKNLIEHPQMPTQSVPPDPGAVSPNVVPPSKPPVEMPIAPSTPEGRGNYSVPLLVVGGVLVLILLGVRLRSWRKAKSTRQN